LIIKHMRTALTALTDELRRLKAAGVKSVAVSDDTLAALRAAVAAQKAAAGPVTARIAPAPPLPAAIAPAAERPAVSPPAPAPEKPPVRAAAPLLPPPPVVLPVTGDKATRWAALSAQMQADPVCQAHVRPGKKLVLGVGDLNAQIFFAGEAPGAEEEIQGEPFVGPAGQLLTKMIVATGLQRSQVYIGNIMNWRPELPVDAEGVQFGNRPPTAEELAYCLPYLRAQIEIVDPAIIVALGGTAAQGLLGPDSFKTVGEIRGRWKEFAGKPLIVTYHPSYILRSPTNRSKRMIWEDFLKVMGKAQLPISEKQQAFFLDK
jgi:uracil-DNA glycosylase family 4